MQTIKDNAISIVIFLVLFTALAIDHSNSLDIIEQQHNQIYQNESQIEDLKYQIGQCRLITPQYSEYGE